MKYIFKTFAFLIPLLLSLKVFAGFDNPSDANAWLKSPDTAYGNHTVTNGTFNVIQGGGTWGIDASGGQMNMGTNSGSGFFDFNVILQGALDNVTHSRLGSFRSSSTIASFESAGSAQIVLDNNNNETGTSFSIRHNDYATGPVLFSVSDTGVTSAGQLTNYSTVKLYSTNTTSITEGVTTNFVPMIQFFGNPNAYTNTSLRGQIGYRNTGGQGMYMTVPGRPGEFASPGLPLSGRIELTPVGAYIGNPNNSIQSDEDNGLVILLAETNVLVQAQGLSVYDTTKTGKLFLSDFSVPTLAPGKIYFKDGSQLYIYAYDGTNSTEAFIINKLSVNCPVEFHSPYMYSDVYQSETTLSYLDLSGDSIYLFSTNSGTIDAPKITFPNIVSAGELMCSVNDSTTTMLQSWTNSAVSKYQKEWHGISIVAGGSGKSICNPVKGDGSPIFSTVQSAFATPRTTNTTAAGAMFSQRIYGSDVNGTNISFITVANGAFVANNTTNDVVVTGFEIPGL